MGTTGARVHRVRYDCSAAMLPAEIADDGAVRSGPSYSPAISRSHIGNEVRSVRKDQEV